MPRCKSRENAVEVIYFTVIAIGLYFFAGWLLDRIEVARGARFKNRDIVYFAIILPLAVITFWFIGLFGG
ncbi:MAG: hypothetical protein ACOZDY_19000 [Pseudomonadota bacterium]